MADRLQGRHVLITGGASGIGRATAELFAAEGAKLALLDCNGEGVRQVAQELGVEAIAFNLADLEGIDAVVARAAAAMGGLDGVVNCAAIASGGPLSDLTLDRLNEATAVNLLAPFILCRAALPHLRRHKGATVVNIASGQGILPNTPNNTVYAATKGGLIAFSKALAAELAPDIRVNAVAPGVVQTAMTQGVLGNYDNPNDAPFVQQYAMKRVAQPIELANAILFLTCDESSFVTGSALAVDGGRCFH